MHARSTTIRGNPDRISQAVAYMHDKVLPVVQEMDGCIGLSMLVERDTGRCIATSAWRDEQSMRASAERMHPMRQRLVEVFGGEPQVEEWEIAVLHRAQPTSDGACARVTWVSIPPDRMEQMLDGYRENLMPRLQELPGFCSLSLLVDRRRGRAVGVVSLESREALDATRERVRGLREEFTRSVGGQVTEVAEMDLVLAHLRVPETV